jgi:phospholipase C
MLRAALLSAAALSLAEALSDTERLAQIEQLRDTIHSLPAAEQARRFATLQRRVDPPPRQKKIDHFVVLYMENQAMLRTLGCMDLPGMDGLPKEGMRLPVDPKNASKGMVNITCGTGEYVCKSGPGFSFLNAFFEKGADASKYPYPPQKLENAALNGAHGNAVQMFSAEQLPIKAEIAQNFGVFNKMYTASPTMSWPNHMFTQTGTSCGCTSTGPTYDQGGGPSKVYPQFTIYDSMALDNVSFGLYANVTCGVTGHPACTEAAPAFDTYMAGVARHSEHFFSQRQFYAEAAAGTLPAFSFFSPSWQSCDHPCNDLAKGERVLKDVYESLRAGPKWDNTLFLVTYDDIGGYCECDHPPSFVVSLWCLCVWISAI